MLQKHSGLSGGSSMDVDGDTSDASDQTDEEVVNEEANDKVCGVMLPCQRECMHF